MSAPDNDAPIAGHADAEHESPWSMQLIVHVEKSDPPTRTAALEAAAIATVRLLDSADATSDWRPAIERWMAGRIRKHVRRARGGKWDRVQELPGVTVAHGGAEVRALVPTSVDDTYPDVAKLQLSGRDLDDPHPHAELELEPGVLTIAVSADRRLSWTKAAASTGHAAQIARMQMPTDKLEQWRAAGFIVRVEHPDVARWRQLIETAEVKVVDAGLTEVPSGFTTSVAHWL